MCDMDSTRTCQVCGSEYKPRINKNGVPRKTKHNICSEVCQKKWNSRCVAEKYREATKRKNSAPIECKYCGAAFLRPSGNSIYCSLSCRKKNEAEKRKKKIASKNHPKCRIPSCNNKAVCKSLCSNHYQAQRKYGDPHGSAPPKRVSKDCGWCGKTMTLKPAEARKRKACSRLCGSRIRNGGTRERDVNCQWCHKTTVRVVRKTGDRGMYCSKQCGRHMNGFLASEAAALRRIADQHNRRAERRQRREDKARAIIVSPEVAALKRIGVRVASKSAKCRNCDGPFFRVRKRQLYCSHECRAISQDQTKKRRMESESYRAARARYKAQRRSRLIAAHFEPIDPLHVFEESGWKCYICGVDTPQDKRGSYDDDAPELDHIYPLAAGGIHARCNVACCCRSCNLAKGADIIMGPSIRGRVGSIFL